MLHHTVQKLYFFENVIGFVLISAKFDIRTVVGVVGLNGTLVDAKIRIFKCTKVIILDSTSVPFRPMAVQWPNLALIETKRPQYVQ